MADPKKRTTTTQQGTAKPPQAVDVMIVPRAPATNLTRRSTLTIFQQNWLFARQWRKSSPSTRAVVEVPVNGRLADLEAAVQTAAAKASGKRVVLCVGHGGAGSFRGLTQSVFDSLPETAQGMLNHVGAMTSEVVVEFRKIAENKGGKWVPKRRSVGGVIVTESQAKIDSLAPRFETLLKIGKLLQDAHVHDFTVLSCNAGRDAAFGAALAKRLGVEVHLYDRLVAMAEAVFTKTGQPDVVKTQVWLVQNEAAPAANRPPSDDPDHASFHEIPTDHERTFSP
jgi:hypothetical protein